MSDRLESLKRQREAVADQLRSLDREIAEESARVSQPGASTPPAPVPAREAVLAAVEKVEIKATPATPELMDDLLTKFQQQERQQTQLSKSGCWTVFALLMIGAIVAITALLFLRYS